MKIGDIVVRTNEAGGIHSLNRILKIKDYDGPNAIRAEDDELGNHSFTSLRFATAIEIQAYEQGIRNTKYIEQNNYECY